MPTIIIASLIGVLVLSIIIKEIKNRRAGKGSCTCGCAGCGNSACKRQISDKG